VNLDENGLPVTINHDGVRDKNDQLQRVAALFQSYWPKIDAWTISRYFTVSPGIYIRFPGSTPDDVSGDQLLSILAAWISRGELKFAKELTWQILKRGGFAQNKFDMYGRTQKKQADFILWRGLPLFWRVHSLYSVLRGFLLLGVLFLCVSVSWWFILLAVFVTDHPLVIDALFARMPVWKDDKGPERRNPDDVDDHPLIMKFIACSETFATPLSFLAPKLFALVRPWNYGCYATIEEGRLARDGRPVPEKDKNFYGPVYGSLRWYHKPPEGNLEIAERTKKLIEIHFGERNP
jgi:hypothetical protein